jgi:hypothetical protein
MRRVEVTPMATTGGASPAAVALASTAYTVGRVASRVSPTLGGASRVGAVAGGAAVTALWAGIFGCVNLKEYKKGKITRKAAVRNTATESVGFGLATTVGIAVANAVRLSAFLASSAFLVFLIGAAATGGAKVAWDSKMKSATAGNETTRQSTRPE